MHDLCPILLRSKPDTQSIHYPIKTWFADNIIEPTELAPYEKGVYMRPDFPAQQFYLSWFIDLLPRYR